MLWVFLNAHHSESYSASLCYIVLFSLEIAYVIIINYAI